MITEPNREQMNLVIVGHVDHGKSTVIGRLLADTNSLPEGKLEAVRLACERNSKPFEYAFLLDALKDEQAQGITIDAARVFFKTPSRYYIILDAPGHIEFLKNMITGAARAESALLVIDAAEGVQENSRRHGYMLSMLGVKQVVILINKMDLVNYDSDVFEKIRVEYESFLNQVGISGKEYIPVSGLSGENIVESGKKKMPWYNGPTVIESLDAFSKEAPDIRKPFRMPIQDIYKFTKFGDNRRIIAGSPVAGTLRMGEEVVFLPSGKRATVKSFETFQEKPPEELLPDVYAGIILNEQIYVTRGEVIVKSSEKHSLVGTKITASLFWLGKEPLVEKKEYIVKLGTAKTTMRLEKINGIIDASTLTPRKKNRIDRNDVADITFSMKKPLAFDLAADNAVTSRFVIIDNYEIAGGGIIRSVAEDLTSDVRSSIMIRKDKWEKGLISMTQRGERYCQRPTLIILAGENYNDTKNLARDLEKRLFMEGRVVYYLGIGDVKSGIGSDDQSFAPKQNRFENVRRLAEFANIILDAGVILIAAADNLMHEDLEIIKSSVNADQVETIWVGDNITADLRYDIHLSSEDVNETDCVTVIKDILQDKGLIFRIWN